MPDPRLHSGLNSRLHLRFVGVLAAISCLALSGGSVAGGTWKFDTEDQGHPRLAHWENDKTTFFVGCGHAFAIHAVYPGTAKKDDDKATISIANSKTQMTFDGVIDSRFSNLNPPNTTHFVQWDLGFARQDPELYGKRWKQLESQLFDFLDSGRPLTISAEGQSYVLPAIKVRGWKERFKRIC